MLTGGNPFLMKPQGFWGSPDGYDERTVYTWKTWCIASDYRMETLNYHMKFKIRKDARILRIERLEDVGFFLCEECGNKILNQEKIQRCFDGMELYHGVNGKNYWILHEGMFNLWDVDSICVWNPDVIEVEGE